MAGDCSVSEGKFKFPECWNNDIRMSALFAPFRSKSVNPTDWNSKMKFWTDIIENWCKYNKCPVIEISSLRNSFSRKGQFPACLEEVINHLCSTGTIVNRDSFMMPDENWKGWAIKVLVTNPLKWTFNTVKSTIIKAEEKETYYVHIAVVKHLSEELLKHVSPPPQGKVINFDDLTQTGFDNCENLSIVLQWMQKQGQAATHQVNGVTLVKLGKTKSPPVKVTETDLGIYSIERHEKVIEESINQLYRERDAALEKTKKHLAAKMKDMAKISLRRKLELEKLIEKRALTLENLQSILSKIEQVKLDSEVIDSYQKGISALREIYKETGLNPQDVTNTMDELQEVLNGRREIEEALARPMDPAADEGLEDELNELLLGDAPEVPRDQLPTSSDTTTEEKTKEIGRRLEALSI